jgi:deoxyuridine 5'-triphosphate nucleotidohydrolase
METPAYTSGNKSLFEYDDEIQLLFNSFTYQEKICFIRGYFDRHGNIVKSLSNPRCSVKINDKQFCTAIQDIIVVPGVETDKGLEYNGINVVEFLHMLYKDAEYVNFNHLYGAYKNLLYCWEPSFVTDNYIQNALSCYKYRGEGMAFKFTKTLDNAVPPKKAHVTDTGYDLCIVKKVKEENGMVMYDTGIAVQPPLGYYFELVGRSSISKTGYIVANSIGIIDASYTGSLKVALIKVNKDAPDMELPARIVQLIPRQLIHLDAIEVSDINDTTRADGGFGSSGQDILKN